MLRSLLSSLALTTLVLSACSGPQPIHRNNSQFQAQPAPLRSLGDPREPLSALMGDPPNFAASSNGDALVVVSGEKGRGAKAGALVEFYYPDLGEDHLWDAYSGIAYNGQFLWLHQFKLVKQEIRPDSDIVISSFVSPDGRLEVSTQDLVLRDRPVAVRQLTVKNRGTEPVRNLRSFFYENLTVNLFPTGDHCEYLPHAGALHHYENQVHFAVGLDQAPEQFQCGGVKNFLTNAQDAMNDTEDGKLHGNLRASAGAGLGVNGSLGSTPRDLAPAETLTQRSFIAASNSEAGALQALEQARSLSWEQMQAQNLTYWAEFLQHSKIPQQPDREREVYKRALIVMKQHSARTGAHLAAPTSTSPPYRFSWPRDGSFIALAHLQAGHASEARAFLDFMAGNQKPNGSWAINYHTNGQAFYDFGDRQNEHDQVGTLPWMMYKYAQETGEWSWLEQKWPVIEKACRYLIQHQDPQTGLIGPTRDLWELSTTDSWTYTNAADIAGLRAGSQVAQRLGQSAAAAEFTLAAERMTKGVETYLWNEQEGFFVRGYNLDSRRQDPKVEAANLALVYPFAVFEANDPRMQKMAAKILTELSSPWGGIRRYSQDRYYGGQPWPVTTEWLAIYFAITGQTAQAQRLHETSTRYAYQTGSLQLGEQYDEQQQRWVSAVPLTWSGAKYILAAQALHPK